MSVVKRERDRLHHWSFLSIICYIVFTSIMFLTLSMPSMDMFSKHAFHLQCVSTWLQSQNSNNPTCPTCRQEWEFGAERTVVDDDAEGEESVDV